MPPAYDLEKIKFATDTVTFEKAVDLYESGKVKNFQRDLNGFYATVKGTHLYSVEVSSRHYDHGNCDCYLGQNDILCKHMVAVAIYAVMDGKPLSSEDKQKVSSPIASGKIGELSKIELREIKKEISASMRYIKAYNMPSKYWFQYQNSLDEGAGRLSEIVSKLPVGKTGADLLIDTLLKLDDKLCRGGVDDSDGTVGDFIEECVEVLKEYVKIFPPVKENFKKLENIETCFEWEKPLINL